MTHPFERIIVPNKADGPVGDAAPPSRRSFLAAGFAGIAGLLAALTGHEASAQYRSRWREPRRFGGWNGHRHRSRRSTRTTTYATGEEGGRATTYALGEEGGGATTYALGEEGGGATTYALGEEGGGATTHALGEEGGRIGPRPPRSRMTTFALGEEG